AVAGLATVTGQWPEAIHPRLRTGCMGDGQHAWAAAEWIMMIRNSFVFEEEFEDKLVVGAGLSPEWCAGSDDEGREGKEREERNEREEPQAPQAQGGGGGGRAAYGPAPTRFGPVTVSLAARGDEVELAWSGEWFAAAPVIEIRFPE